MAKRLVAYSPNGDPIKGTYELIPAIAPVDWYRNKDGEIDFDHNGDESEVFWDCGETQTQDGKTLFTCAGGSDWTFDQLVFEEEDDAEV